MAIDTDVGAAEGAVGREAVGGGTETTCGAVDTGAAGVVVATTGATDAAGVVSGFFVDVTAEAT